MACYHPIQGYQATHPNANGRRPLDFRERTAFPVTVPCGQCIGCRLERARQWSVRLMHEAQLHELKIFITLTYSDDKLPAGNSLCLPHFQSFMKRLRKAHGSKIRFFHCGEYGETTQRPHYHAILFGIDFADKTLHSKNGRGETLYKSEKLNALWGHGHCLIGAVSSESCNYVARYILKKVTGDNAKEHYENLNLSTGEIFRRAPEYVTMSRRPGIASAWFDAYAGDVFPSDRVIVGGKETGTPKFYTRVHLRENPSLEKHLKLTRKRRAKKRAFDNTPERLRVRETVKKAAISTLKGTL